MGLNPSSANGLVACTDAQFAKGTDDPIACPAASKIGTVEVQTPSLPADSLTGTVYVGAAAKPDPAPANSSGSSSTPARSATASTCAWKGRCSRTCSTGQLTALVDENPQATFSSFKLHINGGPRGDADQPADLRPEHDQHGADAVVGQRRRDRRPAASR